MAKISRIQGDMDDVDALLEILSVIKDVATNRFFAFAQRKANFQTFFDMFMVFFREMQNIDVQCPLIKNDCPKVTILTIASDAGFMGQLNNRVSAIAFNHSLANPGSTISCLGRRCAERLKMLGVRNIDRIFTMAEFPDRYILSLAIRDYLVDRVISGKAGKVVIVHLWAKSFTIIKPRILTILPASELIKPGGGDITEGNVAAEETKGPEDKVKKIMEATPEKMMKALADIWIHARLFEIMADILLVEAAVQAQQLETALESLGSEKKALLTSFRKAGRDELNKATREVFTQTSVAKGQTGR